MPLVIMALPLGDAGAHRQDWLRALQRLALAFLVNAKDDSFLRGIQIQADDVPDLFNEHRVFREFDPFYLMGFQPECFPNSANRVIGDSRLLSHLTTAPVCASLWLLLKRFGDDLLDLLVGYASGRT